jgi:YD repeat-containing protein
VIPKSVPASASGATRYSVYYGYDLRNAQLYARFGGPTGLGITNAYDGFGRQTSSITTMDGVSRTILRQYDTVLNRETLTHPDGLPFTYVYDAAGRMAGVYQGAGTSLLLVGGTYDTSGHLTTITRQYGDNTTLAYDGVNRLTELDHYFVAGTGNVTSTFGYNPAGQIVTRTRSNDAYASNTAYNVSRPYTANGLNQYTAAGSASFTYDANGNLTGDGTNTYVYDDENRLVTATGSHPASLAYDPLGRLWQVTNNATGAVTRFVYDGDALIAEYDASGAMTSRYVHGSNAAADDPLVWYDSAGNRHWLHADQQGSIVAISAPLGDVSTINGYDAWGIPNAANAGRFQYTCAPETGRRLCQRGMRGHAPIGAGAAGV